MKRLILWGIRRLGYDLVRPNPRPRGFNAHYLPKIVTPRTVFDVGVGFGTPALYQAFPAATFVLVEPLREQEGVINQICARHSCRVYYNAVGRQAGVVEFTVDLDSPELSSLERRTPLTTRKHSVTTRQIEMTTLDAILRENPDLERPILLKLDTEGHELEALAGGTELLGITDTVIAEVSVARRFEGGYGFEDMILFMRERGFRLVDILSIAHGAGELEPRHMDVVFKRADYASVGAG